jgi:putative transposase
MNSTKSNFTKDYKARQKIAHSVSLSLWQPRFWDHIIRDAEDLERHFEYIHYNPIKHSLVTRPEDYGHSSYRYWLEKGYYEVGWGWAEEPTSLQDVKEAGEPT